MRRQLRARVHGMVQGVGFRWFVLRRAEPLNLAGWVRNCPDGTVEVLAEGPDDDLGRLIEALRRGPAASRVRKVDEEWGDPQGDLDGFAVRY